MNYLKAYSNKGIYFFIILSLVHLKIAAQKVENVHFEQAGKQIIIYYDLTGTQQDQTFDIQIFCSTDGGKTLGSPLSKVNGDVGTSQVGGLGKRIVWDVLKERDKIEGEILFEVHVLNTSKFDFFTDQRDRKIYKSVKIGSQVWMAQNLNYATSSRSWCYGNDISNCDKYGRLYDWETAKTACPLGWHLPLNSDWKILIAYLDGEGVAGAKLKSKTGWKIPDTGSTNESGFSALPSGYRDYGGAFFYVGSCSLLWSFLDDEFSNVQYIFLESNKQSVFLITTEKYGTWGLSIRCIKDN
jgi:uncharacterized protein (TIGR02145 family)